MNNGKKSPTFGKIMLASGVGTLIVLLIIGLFKILIFVGIVGALNEEAPAPVKGASFLKINLTKSLNERTPSQLDTWYGNTSSVGFNDLLRCIDAAAEDDNIKGIYLYMGSTYPLSWGKSEELRQVLETFKLSGKPVLAYADGYSQQGIFLASAADSIYLNPSGMVEFRGIGAEALFFKEMLDKLAVKMTLVRPGSNSFKSAGETYTMNQMSDANRTQVREYLQSIWNYVVERISEARGLSPETADRLASNLDAVLPSDALAAHIVDRLCFENDIVTTMDSHYGSSNIVELDDYQKLTPKKLSEKNKIAIIYAEGDVVTGTGFGTAVYSDKITKALNDPANDDNIKAIVLRVNSPGGMVTASEIMTDAVRRAKEKKPVVVSMGDVAASAGYEISCFADCIVAQPTTITGSIGVFATLPEIGGALRKHLGITTDTVKTNENSTALSVLRPLSPRALELLQRNVEDFYKVFVQRVADGRNLPYNYVDSIARGRVWTGLDAVALGLVDTLGGLQDAVAIAAKHAGIDNYRAVDYPYLDGLLTELMERRGHSSGTISPNSHRLATPISGDRVWVGTAFMTGILDRIIETRGLQARVEFFLLTE